MSVRHLDHLVLPTASLAAARQRLTALGFTVAPDAAHPFGTANCCVFLPDGTYLEPLAVADEQQFADAIQASNVFAARFHAYRFRRSRNGFSAVAFATDDAARDHEGLVASGWSAGPMLEFSRAFEGPNGGKVNATFRLAFANDWRAPDCLFFTCQRIDFPTIDRRALESHNNGVVAIRSVVFGAPQPAYFVPYLRAATGVEQSAFSFTRDDMVSMRIGKVNFDFLDNQMIARNFDEYSNPDQGLQGRVVVFGVASYRETEAWLKSKNVKFFKFRKRIVVPPAPGQGAIFAFESNHEQA